MSPLYVYLALLSVYLFVTLLELAEELDLNLASFSHLPSVHVNLLLI